MSRNQQPHLIFPVISDVHIAPTGDGCITKFERALSQLNNRAPHQDAFVIVGDLTNNGYAEEYDRNMEVFRKHKLPSAQPLIAIGNHDYWNGLPTEEAQALFLEKTGMPSLYYHEVIQGYHFIVMGTEQHITPGHFSLEQIAWLSEQLQTASADTPNRPIFVFMHQPLTDTVYGSEEWGTVDNLEAFMDALKPYPQVITFSGHSHYPLNDPRSIHQQYFTSVGTASLSYMEVERGKLQGNLPPGHEQFCQGCLVEVYEDQVVIHRLDFANEREIDEAWVVSLPATSESFIYRKDRDQEAPFFPLTAEIHVAMDLTTSHSVTITFDQATDNELVHSYQITLCDASTNEELHSYLAYSEYYNYPLVEQITLTLPDLLPDHAYSLTVHAIDAFGNVSEQPLVTSCRTQSMTVSS
ncbi:metallophosphoesterase [Paenibacillus sp. EC2-1]|uniref:metallophosphoesterase n=1 Tax=Paenibacillus sp. EC2-1 TaxID=3388665 RepID=UPI003BEED39D